MARFAVYLERWIGLQRPRIGWWRQCAPGYFQVPGPKVSKTQTRILEDAGLNGEGVDNVHFRWQVRPHPENVEVSEEPTFERAGGAP